MLIFSQMVRVLDIVSDYMRMRGFQHQRLDGSTPAAQRHQVGPALGQHASCLEENDPREMLRVSPS